MGGRVLLGVAVGLVILGLVAIFAPVHAFGGGSCGNIFTARTLPDGTRFNSVGPVNICSHASVHRRTFEAVAVLVVAMCTAAVGVLQARR
jgi:hypothetical protein